MVAETADVLERRRAAGARRSAPSARRSTKLRASAGTLKKTSDFYFTPLEFCVQVAEKNM